MASGEIPLEEAIRLGLVPDETLARLYGQGVLASPFLPGQLAARRMPFWRLPALLRPSRGVERAGGRGPEVPVPGLRRAAPQREVGLGRRRRLEDEADFGLWDPRFGLGPLALGLSLSPPVPALRGGPPPVGRARGRGSQPPAPLETLFGRGDLNEIARRIEQGLLDPSLLPAGVLAALAPLLRRPSGGPIARSAPSPVAPMTGSVARSAPTPTAIRPRAAAPAPAPAGGGAGGALRTAIAAARQATSLGRVGAGLFAEPPSHALPPETRAAFEAQRADERLGVPLTETVPTVGPKFTPEMAAELDRLGGFGGAPEVPLAPTVSSKFTPEMAAELDRLGGFGGGAELGDALFRLELEAAAAEAIRTGDPSRLPLGPNGQLTPEAVQALAGASARAGGGVAPSGGGPKVEIDPALARILAQEAARAGGSAVPGSVEAEPPFPSTWEPGMGPVAVPGAEIPSGAEAVETPTWELIPTGAEAVETPTWELTPTGAEAVELPPGGVGGEFPFREVAQGAGVVLGVAGGALDIAQGNEFKGALKTAQGVAELLRQFGADIPGVGAVGGVAGLAGGAAQIEQGQTVSGSLQAAKGAVDLANAFGAKIPYVSTVLALASIGQSLASGTQEGERQAVRAVMNLATGGLSGIVDMVTSLINLGLGEYKRGDLSKRIMNIKQQYISQYGNQAVEEAIRTAPDFSAAARMLVMAPPGTSGQVQFGVGQEYAGKHLGVGQAGSTETPQWRAIIAALSNPRTVAEHPDLVASFIQNLWVQTGPTGAAAFNPEATRDYQVYLLSKLPSTPEWIAAKQMILSAEAVDPRDTNARDQAMAQVPKLPVEPDVLRVNGLRIPTDHHYQSFDGASGIWYESSPERVVQVATLQNAANIRDVTTNQWLGGEQPSGPIAEALIDRAALATPELQAKFPPRRIELGEPWVLQSDQTYEHRETGEIRSATEPAVPSRLLSGPRLSLGEPWVDQGNDTYENRETGEVVPAFGPSRFHRYLAGATSQSEALQPEAAPPPPPPRPIPPPAAPLPAPTGPPPLATTSATEMLSLAPPPPSAERLSLGEPWVDQGNDTYENRETGEVVPAFGPSRFHRYLAGAGPGAERLSLSEPWVDQGNDTYEHRHTGEVISAFGPPPPAEPAPPPPPDFPSFQTGGTVPKTGLYRLHAGENVLPSRLAAVQALRRRPAGPPPSLQQGGQVPQTGLYRLHEGEEVIPAKHEQSETVQDVPEGRWFLHPKRGVPFEAKSNPEPGRVWRLAFNAEQLYEAWEKRGKEGWPLLVPPSVTERRDWPQMVERARRTQYQGVHPAVLLARAVPPDEQPGAAGDDLFPLEGGPLESPAEAIETERARLRQQKEGEQLPWGPKIPVG